MKEKFEELGYIKVKNLYSSDDTMRRDKKTNQ